MDLRCHKCLAALVGDYILTIIAGKMMHFCSWACREHFLNERKANDNF